MRERQFITGNRGHHRDSQHDTDHPHSLPSTRTPLNTLQRQDYNPRRPALAAFDAAGHTVEAGTDLLVCPYLTHRDPELWPDPERFDPRRFTAPDGRPTHPGAYFPFGIGPRACLGLQFALRESTVLLEHLLPAHTPAFHSAPTKAVYGITVRPDGPTPATLTPALMAG